MLVVRYVSVGNNSGNICRYAHLTRIHNGIVGGYNTSAGSIDVHATEKRKRQKREQGDPDPSPAWSFMDRHGGETFLPGNGSQKFAVRQVS